MQIIDILVNTMGLYIDQALGSSRNKDKALKEYIIIYMYVYSFIYIFIFTTRKPFS